MASIILSPEVYPSWLLDNSTVLLYDSIFIDRQDYIQQQTLSSRSTFDSKMAAYLKALHEDLGILKLRDYSQFLSPQDRTALHKRAASFASNPKNLADSAIIGKQAWYNYSDYLTEKIKLYDDPDEPAMRALLGKRTETIQWRDRLFNRGVLRPLGEQETKALQHAVTRTLSKAIAAVKIYQYFSWEYAEKQQFVLHDRMEYEHAFSVAASLELGDSDGPSLAIGSLQPEIVAELVYECYRVYCAKFDIPLIEQPSLLYDLRADFKTYRAIMDDFNNLFARFSYDVALTRSYVLSQMERILIALRRELLVLANRIERVWGTLGSVSLLNLPVGQLIRLLAERKANDKAVQDQIDKFFSVYSNRRWKNLFVFLKSSENYTSLGIERKLVEIDDSYFKLRPDWWIDYLPWYEGGTTQLINK